MTIDDWIMLGVLVLLGVVMLIGLGAFKRRNL